ncbi:MAG: DUF3021 domain-containing protein [Firmicutes bacterium]|nr:DUF3021 domain-containing protein [Bacillota bacterium]
MRIGDLVKTMVHSYFVITTGIIASMYVFCLIFNRNAVYSLDDIGRILLMALASDLPFIIFYSRKELGKKQMLIRQIIHIPFLLAVLFYFAQLWDWVRMNSPTEVIVFIALVLVVYAAVLAIATFQDKKLADKLNDRLKQRYHS